MKRHLMILAAMALIAGCSDGERQFLGSYCDHSAECGGFACVNHVCIVPCKPDSCEMGQECLAEGICVDAALVQCSMRISCGAGQACIYGTCSGSTGPECSDTKPCPSHQVCNPQGICIDVAVQEPECSDTKPCPSSTQVCSIQGKCIEIGSPNPTPQEPECSASKPCPVSQVCNLAQGQCVDRCTATSCGTGYVCGTDGFCVQACVGNSCAEGYICVNRMCVAACTENSCPSGEFCGADGLCVARCTSTSCPAGTVCMANGACEAACTAGECPEGQVCGDAGLCVEAECSQAEPCANGRVCSYGKCYDVALASCYVDRDCPAGYHCDNLKCVDENSCSMTRTCADNKICQEGMCTDPVPVACDKKTPCADANKTCVAGQCVTCQCGNGQICTSEGTCVDAKSSSDGKVKNGDPCTWGEFTSFCDENRQFLCVDGRVSVTNCGANICAVASEEGLGCHEPCAAKDAFYGVCVDMYESHVAFTHVCEETPQGLIWTLKHGFEECLVGCTDGRCDFVPAEFGMACTVQSYPDACQGDWLTYCYSVGTMNMAAGTLCTTLSNEHFCALPSQTSMQNYPGIIGTCATSCQTLGEKGKECRADAEGGEYSMSYVCAETTTGILAKFEIEYEPCARGCDRVTGACQ